MSDIDAIGVIVATGLFWLLFGALLLWLFVRKGDE